MLRRSLHGLTVPVLALFGVGGLIACGNEDGGVRRIPETTSLARGPIQGGYADSTTTGVVGIVNQNLGACTGSLIAPNVVLTARHCVTQVAQTGVNCTTDNFGTPLPANGFYVFNDAVYDQQNTFLYGVKEVHVPTETAFCGNDVAILILKQNFSSSVATLIEPSVNSPAYANETYSAVGYGISCYGCNDSMERRRRDNLTVQCMSSCAPPDVMSTKEWYGDDGVCSGDSGGPALDPQGRVIGIASRAGHSGSTCVGGIYERVDLWKSFIVQQTLSGATQGGYSPPAWTGGGGAGGATQTCDVCSQQSLVPAYPCNTAYNNCVTSQACLDYWDCVNACTTSACQIGCYNSNLDGAHIYGGINECICTTGCPTECAADCAGPQCGWSLDGDCGTCFTGSCCSEGQACSDLLDCVDLVMCINPCKTQTCINNCVSKHQTGSTVYNTWMDCLETKCTTQCGFNTGGSGGAGGTAGAAGTGGSSEGGSGGTGGVGGDGGSSTGGSSTGGSSTGGSSTGGSNPGGAGQGGANQGGASGKGGSAVGGSGQGGNKAGAGGMNNGGSGGESQGGAAGEPQQLVTDDSSGCGCATPGRQSSNPVAWLALAAALTALRKRRASP